MKPARKLATIAAALVVLVLGVGTTSALATQRANKKQTLNQAAKAAFPNGIELVTGSAPGGSQDITSRLVQEYLQPILGVPITVLNQTGGGGLQAFQTVYNASPRSGIISLTYASQLSLNYAFLDAKLKPTKFAAIARIFGSDPVVMVAAKGSRWTNFNSLKTSPSTITIGVSDPGGTGTWLAAAYLQLVNHLHVQIIPFSSGLAAADAAVGGSIDIASTLLPESTTLTHAGKAQAVVEFGPKPVNALPGVEAMGKLGYATEDVVEDNGVIGPPKMPQSQIAVLQKGILRMIGEQSFLSAVQTQSLIVSWLPETGWSKEISAFFGTFHKQIPALNKLLGLS